MNCDNARQKGKDPNQCGLQSSNALGDESSASGGNTSAGENFPAKLHYMLSEIERDGLGHIVSWQPHGRCFMVHKQKEFEQKILPL